MDYNKWLNHTFSSSSYPLEDYIQFQKEMRQDLRKIVSKFDLELHSFSKNHYEFSAVLKDKKEDKFIYVSISDVRGGRNSWYDSVLIRTMKNDKDWTGGNNHYCKWTKIGEEARNLIEMMKKQEKTYDLELEI